VSGACSTRPQPARRWANWSSTVQRITST